MTGGAPVLIVDPDGRFRASVSRLLARAGLSASEAACGEDALAAVAVARPAAVVLEACLPDVDGFEVCRELRDLYEDLPVLIVSEERAELHDRIAGLLIGADDYLVKPVNADELLARLRRLLSRPRPTSAAAVPERRNGLTGRESEVLGLLAQGVDAAGISAQLVISQKTVASHLQRVMAKLGVHSRAQAVAEAYRLGLVRSADVEAHGAPLEPEASEEPLAALV